jgi:hypothetical protein
VIVNRGPEPFAASPEQLDLRPGEYRAVLGDLTTRDQVVVPANGIVIVTSQRLEKA